MAAEPTEHDYATAVLMLAIGPTLLLSSSLLSRALGRSKPAELAEPRALYFDTWRLLCFTCAAVLDACDLHAEWGTAFVMQWVWQLVMVIDGTCFGFSKFSPTQVLAYSSRHVFIFSLGCALNWAGAVVAGRAWWDDPLAVISFQMTLFLIMGFAAVLGSPLKAIVEEGASWRAQLRCGAFYLLLTASSALAWRRSPTPLTSALTCASSLLLLASFWVSATAAAGRRRSLLGWGMLLWIYGSRLLLRGGREGFWVHLGSIFCWALLVQRVPLLWAEEVGMVLLRGWPFFLIGGGMLGSHPEAAGRPDLHPFERLIDRARFNHLELLFVLSFVTIPAVGAGDSVPMPAALGPHLPCLRWWSLAVYCCHEAVYCVVEPCPHGVAISLSSCVAFVLVWRLAQRWRPPVEKPVALPPHQILQDASPCGDPGPQVSPTVLGACMED